MAPDTVPVTHIQLGLQLLGFFLSLIIACITAAWAGAKLAMRSFNVEIKGINSQLSEVVDNQKQLRRVTLVELQREVHGMVPKDRCDEDRGACGLVRTQSFCEMTKQVGKLTESIELLNDKREQAKDAINAMFNTIMEKINAIEKRAVERRKTNGETV